MPITPAEVRLNANHLKRVDDETLSAVISDVDIAFISFYSEKWAGDAAKLAKLNVAAKFLAQHIATLNVRRPDSEGLGGMSKSLSVAKDMALDQTEYGQMAKKIGKMLGCSWASEDDKPASVVIF